MDHYSILVFGEGLSANSIFHKFSEQELAYLVFSAHGNGGIDGAIQYLSQIRDHHELGIFLISAARKQSAQAESEQRMLAEALRDTANALNQSLDLREVLDCILNKVGSVVPNDAANIMLIEDGIARMAACRGYEKLGGEERVMRQARILNEVPNLRRMAETGLPMVVSNTKQSTDWVDFDTSSWINSYASVPICHKGRTIGFLNLNSSIPNFYNDAAAERLLAFADQAAIAIENARLYTKAQQEIADRKRAEKALQETMNELESRVMQRTLELSSANEQLKLELARRKQAEEELEEERALLASRVEERTAELSTANAELAKAMRLKDTFLANMSHELRTPLNAILNISETLQEQVYGPLNDTQMKSMKTIEDSGRHLLALINDILDLSKIGAGKFEINLDAVPVRDVCQASIQLIGEAARKKQLTVSPSFDPAVKTVWADQRRLKQILLNLLYNAVKFTPAGGSIGLSVTGNCEEKSVEFTVWDTGIGIPESKFGNLFKPFVQLDSSLSRQYEGTGLGLALVYHIVELHGGGIRMESEVGKGSRFTVTLNWDGESGNPSLYGNADDVERIDEETGNSVPSLNHFLQEMEIGTENIRLERGWVQKLEQASPDFVLVDSHLLEHGVMKLIRKESQARNIPIIIVGNQNDPPDLARDGDQAGYLSAPFNRQNFRELIKRVSQQGTASLVHKAVILREKAPLEQGGSKATILIADENENEFRFLNDYFMEKGYRVVRAYNSTEIIERSREEVPNIILLDIQTPGTSGFEAVHRIRTDPKIKPVPIIAFTALMMPGDRERCIRAGVNDYIGKPLRCKKLLETIEKQLSIQPN